MVCLSVAFSWKKRCRVSPNGICKEAILCSKFPFAGFTAVLFSWWCSLYPSSLHLRSTVHLGVMLMNKVIKRFSVAAGKVICLPCEALPVLYVTVNIFHQMGRRKSILVLYVIILYSQMYQFLHCAGHVLGLHYTSRWSALLGSLKLHLVSLSHYCIFWHCLSRVWLSLPFGPLVFCSSH